MNKLLDKMEGTQSPPPKKKKKKKKKDIKNNTMASLILN